MTRPADRRGDRRVLEIQLGLAQGGARLGHLRLDAHRLRAADRHLAPPAAGLAERGLGRLELPARLGQRHLLRGHLGFGLGDLGVRHVHALPRRLDGRLAGPERGLRVVELLTRDQPAIEQLPHAPVIEARALEVRLARRDVGLRRLDGRPPRHEPAAPLLQRPPRAVDTERRPRHGRLGARDLAAGGLVRHGHALGRHVEPARRGRERRPGLVDLHLQVPRIQARERRPRRHLLVVAHEDFQNGAAHAGADRRDVPLDERVVGRDVAAPVAPGVDAVRAGGQHDEAEEDEDQGAPGRRRAKVAEASRVSRSVTMARRRGAARA